MFGLTEEQKLQIIRQKQIQNTPGLIPELIKFFFNISIVLPIWFFCLLPFTIFVGLSQFIYNKIFGKKPITQNQEQDSGEIIQSMSEKTSRKYDLVMYGATGFTGKLATEYLLKFYSGNDPKLKWAVAGRSVKKLEQILADLSKKTKVNALIDIIQVNADNIEDIKNMVNQTRVVLTTVGPFALYGTNLVKCCALYGTDYVDITGEIDWVREMITKYDNIASESGARIVNCCAFDSIPWDMPTYLCAQQLKKEHNQDIQKIFFANEFFFNPSGGTLATAINVIETQGQRKKSEFDPLIKLCGLTSFANNKLKLIGKVMTYDKQLNRWLGISLPAEANSCVIKRSCALGNYGKDLQYQEQFVFPNFFFGINFYIQLIVFVTLIFNKVLRYILLGTIIPKPGQGPSEKQLEEHYFNTQCTAYGDKGAIIKCQFTLPYEPGYKDTARMCVECALCFVFNKTEISQSGGVYTPGSCLKDALKDRLVKGGSVFRFLN